MEAPDLIEASEDTEEEETDDEAEMTPDRVDRLIELLSR
jgi:hypothetical protein